nr:putative L-ascorbate peroxidase 6 isoform X2 [Tanacetum cinerariifolium]
MANTIILAGAEAVSLCEGLTILIRLGRLDSVTPDPEGKLPEETLDAFRLKQSFQTQELVALSGAHTLRSKGYGNPVVFDNAYYKVLLEKPWQSLEETRQEEEESFDPIPRTPEESEEERNDEEDQDLRLNTHVTLTPVNPDGPQESSSMSSFVSSMLNPISDVGVESIFMTTSSPIVSLQSQTPIMTPSTIATITTSGEAPIPPPTIPSIILENLSMFNSAFRFEERLRSLETSFSEYRQTNPFADAVSAIPGRSTTGSQSRQMSASESAFAEEPVQTTCQMEEPPHPVFDTGADDQPIVQTSQHPEWFSQPRRPPSPDRAWNTTLPAAQGDAQSWISDLARQTDARSSFNELLDTHIDFSNFIMHQLNYLPQTIWRKGDKDRAAAMI